MFQQMSPLVDALNNCVYFFGTEEILLKCNFEENIPPTFTVGAKEQVILHDFVEVFTVRQQVQCAAEGSDDA